MLFWRRVVKRRLVVSLRSRLTEYLEQYPVLKALYYASYQLDVPYGEDWELIQDILKQGPAVEVISPSRLRRKIKNLASEMASRYE